MYGVDIIIFALYLVMDAFGMSVLLTAPLLHGLIGRLLIVPLFKGLAWPINTIIAFVWEIEKAC